MIEILKNIQSDQAIILTAPPGWGKTYKLLEAIRELERKVLFVFPLRALCDEVYLAAESFEINCCNCRSVKDFKSLDWKFVDLALVTPECLGKDLDHLSSIEPIVILDECHLIYYWGETFREKMFESYLSTLSCSYPLILLSATVSRSIFKKLKFDLEFNYTDITHINIGNRELKNTPSNIFYYPRMFSHLLMLDILHSNSSGTRIIFCQYRDEVFELAQKIDQMGYEVLSCVGGEAKEFVEKLQVCQYLDFIVCTSVLGHGVNLPKISKVYFTYFVENLDFYLQMIGRGGRDGEAFELHTFNSNYFKKFHMFMSIPTLVFKSISNKLKSYLYYLHAC